MTPINYETISTVIGYYSVQSGATVTAVSVTV